MVKWDFIYDEQFPDEMGANVMGVCSNGDYVLFFHVYSEGGEIETCHIYASICDLVSGDNEECSYPWTAENDALLLECLNNLEDERDFCGEGSPIRTLKFLSSEECE